MAAQSRTNAFIEQHVQSGSSADVLTETLNIENFWAWLTAVKAEQLELQRRLGETVPSEIVIELYSQLRRLAPPITLKGADWASRVSLGYQCYG